MEFEVLRYFFFRPQWDQCQAEEVVALYDIEIEYMGVILAGVHMQSIRLF
jgi:hypothetical protein